MFERIKVFKMRLDYPGKALNKINQLLLYKCVLKIQREYKKLIHAFTLKVQTYFTGFVQQTKQIL